MAFAGRRPPAEKHPLPSLDKSAHHPFNSIIMKKLLFIIGSIVFSTLTMSNGAAVDALKPDAAGYIRDWLMLAPIALPEEGTCGELIVKEQIKGEAALKPKAGDKIKVNDKELTWKSITASTNYFDFNAILKTENDRAAGFMVTYIDCDEEMPDITMAISSNDEGRLYLNGKDIYAFTEARTLELDSDKGKVTLNKGLNVLVFKIINEQNNWQGALRFLDKTGAPIKNLKIKLSP
jgi:hypothetical protein